MSSSWHLFSLVAFLHLTLLTACLDEPFVADTAFAFQQAIEQNQPQVAFDLLTEDVQRQLGEADFAQAVATSSGDPSPVIALFRQNNLNEIPQQAGIERYVVDNLNGYRGVVTIAVLQEGEAWKVANLLLDTLYAASSQPTALPTATPDPNGIYPLGYEVNIQEVNAADQVGNSLLSNFARRLRYPTEEFERYVYSTLTQPLQSAVSAEQLYQLAREPGSDPQALVDILQEANITVPPDLPQQIILYNLCARREYTCGERLFQFTMVKEGDAWRVGNVEGVAGVPPPE